MLRFASDIRGEEAGPHGTVAIDRLGLAPLLDRPARQLSAGQRRRVALARLAASGARVWLMDEPAAALDAPAVEALHGMLRAHLAGGGIAVVATHGDVTLPGARRLDLDVQADASAVGVVAAAAEGAAW